MLMRAIVVAAVSAVVLSPLAAQQAFAARPGGAPLEVPTPTPSATATAGGMNHENMPGMNHGDMGGMSDEEMPGMNHSDPNGMNDENMPGMNHSEMSGMSDEEMPGMSHGGTTAGGAEEAGGSSHSHAEEPTSSQPRPTATLVGVFAAVNAGVMGTAFVLRRRERAKGGQRHGRAAR